ncbi:MAG: DMT family transporter [Pseudomonadales bacterium]|nr:DMT family transporter [Pseudomonadales bacterium]
MPAGSISKAIILLVIGNALAVGSDVFVKVMGEDVPIFQFIFLRSLFSLVILLPLYRRFDLVTPFDGLPVHACRSLAGMVGIFCMVVALTSLPLATANAVFYVAPLLVMLLAVMIFREKLTVLSVFAVFSGFAGIVVILRPVEFNWGALAALVGALALAISAVMVRMLPTQQSTLHRLFLSYLLLLPVSAVFFVWEGLALEPRVLMSAVGSGVLILGYSITVLLAYRDVDANQVTSAEYTGLIWAVAIGWVGFAEVPDLWFVAGSLMIVVPLVWLGLNQRQVKFSATQFSAASSPPEGPV